MAKTTLGFAGQPINALGGVDESISLTEASFANAEGVFPFFNGMHQRMFGKKIIDVNPGQAIYGIQQVFNGICLYGYYVQTDEKLYYHVCNAPPDLRIIFYQP